MEYATFFQNSVDFFKHFGSNRYLIEKENMTEVLLALRIWAGLSMVPVALYLMKIIFEKQDANE